MYPRIHNSRQQMFLCLCGPDTPTVHWKFCTIIASMLLDMMPLSSPDAERSCVPLSGAIICYAWKVWSVFCSARALVLCISIMGMRKCHFQERKIERERHVLVY